MARGYKQPDEYKEIVLNDVDHFKNMGNSPSAKRKKDWVKDEDSRNLLSEVIACGLKAFRQKPVRSNAELIERIDEYFSGLQNRRVPPTVEEFSLYLGYTHETIYEWVNGVNAGFPDTPFPGCTTSEIAKKALELLHNIDAIQAMKRRTDNTTYIFRAKNYYGMTDTREQRVNINLSNIPDALPPAEVAKYLPELAQDTSMDDVEIV